MSKLFKYDVGTLIEVIESKPCLWDKTADCFKDRNEKEKAWKEVYAFLEEGFLQMDKKEQQKIGEIIRGKWQNIRDSFVKSLKKKSGQATTKKYIYHDNLLFLLKVVQADETQSSIDDSQNDKLSLSNESQEEAETETEKEVQIQNNVNAKKRKNWNAPKKTRLQEDIDRKILKALENPIDEDQAFFISITPSVKRMSDEDKLEFRMSVLQLIKDINSRKKIQPPLLSPTSISGSSTPFSHHLFADTSKNNQQTHYFQNSQQQFLPCNTAQQNYNESHTALFVPPANSSLQTLSSLQPL